MKTTHRVALLLAATLAVGCTTGASTRKPAYETLIAPWPKHLPKHPSEIAIKPLQFTPREPEIRELPSGVTLYMYRDDALPLLDVSIYFPYGSLEEPARLTGIGGILGSVWREGGTTTISGEELNDELEFMDASIELTVGERTTILRADSHAKDTDRLLELIGKLITDPALPGEQLERTRARAIEQVRRRLDRPEAIANSALVRAQYGDWHPAARESTAETLAAITRDDLVAMHRRIVGPRGVRVGITGDFDPDTMTARFEALFAGIDGSQQQFWREPSEVPTITPGRYIVNRDATQTQIRMGHAGLPRRHPDWFAVQVLNEIFGAGGFNSRLMQEIRSRRGLTYGVSGFLAEGDWGGRFVIGSSTKNDTVRELIDVAIAEMRRMAEETVAAEELESAKNSMTNAYVFTGASPAQFVAARITEDLFRQPSERRTRYLEGIAAVTAEDIQRVAREHFRPENLVIVLVGPEAELRPQFADAPLLPFPPAPTTAP